MKPRTFIAFVAPSVLMMVVFIAAPLISVLWQSFHVTQPVLETVEEESCTPGFLAPTCVTETKTRPVLGEDGKMLTETRNVGLQSYVNVLEPAIAGLFPRGFEAHLLGRRQCFVYPRRALTF